MQEPSPDDWEKVELRVKASMLQAEQERMQRELKQAAARERALQAQVSAPEHPASSHMQVSDAACSILSIVLHSACLIWSLYMDVAMTAAGCWAPPAVPARKGAGAGAGGAQGHAQCIWTAARARQRADTVCRSPETGECCTQGTVLPVFLVGAYTAASAGGM
jgi:hypothetical protein